MVDSVCYCLIIVTSRARILNKFHIACAASASNVLNRSSAPDAAISAGLNEIMTSEIASTFLTPTDARSSTFWSHRRYYCLWMLVRVTFRFIGVFNTYSCSSARSSLNLPTLSSSNGDVDDLEHRFRIFGIFIDHVVIADRVCQRLGVGRFIVDGDDRICLPIGVRIVFAAIQQRQGEEHRAIGHAQLARVRLPPVS